MNRSTANRKVAALVLMFATTLVSSTRAGADPGVSDPYPLAHRSRIADLGSRVTDWPGSRETLSRVDLQQIHADARPGRSTAWAAASTVVPVVAGLLIARGDSDAPGAGIALAGAGIIAGPSVGWGTAGLRSRATGSALARLAVAAGGTLVVGLGAGSGNEGSFTSLDAGVTGLAVVAGMTAVLAMVDIARMPSTIRETRDERASHESPAVEPGAAAPAEEARR